MEHLVVFIRVEVRQRPIMHSMALIVAVKVAHILHRGAQAVACIVRDHHGCGAAGGRAQAVVVPEVHLKGKHPERDAGFCTPMLSLEQPCTDYVQRAHEVTRCVDGEVKFGEVCMKPYHSRRNCAAS